MKKTSKKPGNRTTIQPGKAHQAASGSEGVETVVAPTAGGKPKPSKPQAASSVQKDKRPALAELGYHFWRVATFRADFKRLSYQQPVYASFGVLALALCLLKHVFAMGMGQSGILPALEGFLNLTLWCWLINTAAWLWHNELRARNKMRRTMPLLNAAWLGSAAVDLALLAAWGAGLFATMDAEQIGWIGLAGKVVLFGAALWRFHSTSQATHSRLYAQPWFQGARVRM